MLAYQVDHKEENLIRSAAVEKCQILEVVKARVEDDLCLSGSSEALRLPFDS